jgi:adenylate kinase
MQYYNNQGKFYAVNGIGSIEKLRSLSNVIDNL